MKKFLRITEVLAKIDIMNVRPSAESIYKIIIAILIGLIMFIIIVLTFTNIFSHMSSI